MFYNDQISLKKISFPIGVRSRALLGYYSLSAWILSCLFASASLSSHFSASPPRGIAIFDTLFISATSIVGIHGDLYLQKAHVLGEGAIRLQSDSAQHIISNKSQVNPLYLANPDRVTLKGDLLVNGSLKAEKGTFYVLRGNLMFSDSAQVDCCLSIKMYAQAIILNKQSTPSTLSFSYFTLEEILSFVFDLQHNADWWKPMRYSDLTQQTLQIALKVDPHPPKEERSVNQDKHFFFQLLTNHHEIYI